jgi:hypothetical protein
MSKLEIKGVRPTVEKSQIVRTASHLLLSAHFPLFAKMVILKNATTPLSHSLTGYQSEFNKII